MATIPFKNVWTSFLNRQFSPSPSTLNNWVATRKNPQMKFPGLLHTHNPEFDSRMYWLAFALELGGVVPSVVGVYKLYDGALFYPLMLIVGAVLGFFIDRQIGIYLRRNDVKNRLNLAQLKIQHILGLSPSAIGLLKMELGDRNQKIVDLLLIGALSLIALIKILPIAFVFRGALGITITMGLIYFFIVYVHVKHTGYKTMNDRFIKSLINDYDTWVNGGGTVLAPVIHNFNFTHASNNYNLSFNCFLQDSDGEKLASGQRDGNFTLVRDYALAAQIKQITGIVPDSQVNLNGTPLLPTIAYQGTTQVAQI
jgi:hypothetical protein